MNRSKVAVKADSRARAVEILANHLAVHGLRLTKQREIILDHMLLTHEHGSTEDIYLILRKRGVGRATVFRTVKLLEEYGLIGQVTGADGTSRYEATFERPHHDHLVCVDCGKFQEVRWPAIERIQSRTCRKLSFTPLWHRHEIFGRCAKCRAFRKPKS